MGSTLLSIDNMLAASADYGTFNRLYQHKTVGTTAATTTSGYISGQRSQGAIIVPSMGSGVLGAYVTYCRIYSNINCAFLMALEYELGTLTVSGNSFAAGVTMPTKTVKGQSIQTASALQFLHISTTLNATTPVVTVTYTDQNGDTGQTCTMTLPTNSATASIFHMAPHMATGDTGMRAVTGMSISTGAGGVIRALGLLVLGYSINHTSSIVPIDPITMPDITWLIEAGETIGLYRFGGVSSVDMLTQICAVPEVV